MRIIENLDQNRIRLIIKDLWMADLAVSRGQNKEAREILELAAKDLQGTSWMLNKPDGTNGKI